MPKNERDVRRLSDLRPCHHNTTLNMNSPNGIRHWITLHTKIDYPQPDICHFYKILIVGHFIIFTKIECIKEKLELLT